MTTTTKDGMLNYTKDEWNNLNYFISIVERLKDHKILLTSYRGDGGNNIFLEKL
jgi:hypothetical protein